MNKENFRDIDKKLDDLIIVLNKMGINQESKIIKSEIKAILNIKD